MKVYISKSSLCSETVLEELRKTISQLGWKILEYQGGMYEEALIYQADIVIAVGHNNSWDMMSEECFYVGKIVGDEISRFLDECYPEDDYDEVPVLVYNHFQHTFHKIYEMNMYDETEEKTSYWEFYFFENAELLVSFADSFDINKKTSSTDSSGWDGTMEGMDVALGKGKSMSLPKDNIYALKPTEDKHPSEKTESPPPEKSVDVEPSPSLKKFFKRN